MCIAGSTPTNNTNNNTPPTQAPCPKCSCCVTLVAIQNISAYNTGARFGHKYDFAIEMLYAAGACGTCDCVLEWWEKTNLPAVPGHPPNAWTDLYAAYSQSPTFDPWKNRTVPCPGGGSSTVTIMDPPALGIRPGRTTQRTLEFRLTVKSCSTGSCANASLTATATQVLEIINGVPNGAGTFTTP